MEDLEKIEALGVPEVTQALKEKTEDGNSIIDESTRFEINEDTLLCSLLLENDNTGARVESKALQEGFKRQDERHVTILGGGTKKLLKNALAKLSEEESRETLREIKKLLSSLSWEFVPKEIYKIKKQGYFGNPNIQEERESYINLIDMPDMEVFYTQLNSLLKTDFPMQVPHITLFTKGESESPKYYGIPVSSMEDFNKMNPEKFLDNTPSHE